MATSAAMRLLLVEDDAMIGEALHEQLRAAGYAADWVRDGLHADAALASEDYDLVVLDLGLPGRDGLDVLQRLRAAGRRMPVLVATARDAVAWRIAGLDAGADDYVVKPYDVDELLARIRSALRRAGERSTSRYEWHDVVVDAVAREASVGGVAVALTAREWAVLEVLLSRPGRLQSRAQIEGRLYDWKHDVASNAVEVHIHALRRKLGATLIQNVRGVGYMVPRG